MKVQISIDDELMKRIDEYSDKTYMSRSGFFTLAATQYLNTNEMLLNIKDMSLCLRKIADNNTLDEDTYKSIEDIQRVCKMFSNTL